MQGKLLRITFVASTFPEDKKRSRSTVISRKLEQRIIKIYLKGNDNEDKLFRHYVHEEK